MLLKECPNCKETVAVPDWVSETKEYKIIGSHCNHCNKPIIFEVEKQLLREPKNKQEINTCCMAKENEAMLRPGLGRA